MVKINKWISMMMILSLAVVVGCSSSNTNEGNAAGNNNEGGNEVITLKAAHYFQPGHPWDMGLEFFAEKVSELSEGQLQVEIFNNGVLGSETDMLQNLREGTLDFAVSDPAAGSTFAKELDFFALPFLFDSYEHWQQTLDGEPGQKYAEIISEKADLKILGYWGGSSRNVLSTDKPIQSMEDLKGFKLRLVQSPLKVNVWQAVGTIPTPIAYLETYSALQSGTVDGMENESVAVVSMKFYEPAPHITRTEHEYTVRPLFMSNKTFTSLSPELQEIVQQAAAEASVYEREVELEAGVKAEKEMEDLGVTFYTIDKEPFREVTSPILADFAEEMELTDIFEQIKQN